MEMLSRLRRFNVVDKHKSRAKLIDLAVDILEGDYPPVTRLFFHNADKELISLPWGSVEEIDWRAREIKVADLNDSQPASAQPSREDVLLNRDILDALILDLQNRGATRANDLWLEAEDDSLLLRAADTSLRAILRRLSRGLYSRVLESDLRDWKYIEFLRGDPQAVRSGTGYHLRITHLPPGEIARLTDPLPYLHAAELLVLLPDQTAADTLEVMSAERQLQVFEELDEEQALSLLTLIAPDVAADIVGRLHSNLASHYLSRLPKGQAKLIIELLRYPEDTVGGIMTNDILTAPAHITVEEARDTLRDRLKRPDFVYFIYVVDDERTKRLRGVITLRELLVKDGAQLLEAIMNTYLVTLHPLESATGAAYKVINSHLAALPVVGREGQVIGAVTVDAAVAQVAPRSWADLAPRVFS
jgi:CBS domain-containing protein